MAKPIWKLTGKELTARAARKKRLAKRYWKRWYKDHKEQHNAAGRKWIRNNRIKIEKWRLRTVYNLSVKEHEKLLKRPCAICGGKSSQIDHNHLTNRVRAALCRSCNLGLGFFKDNAGLCVSAAKYLKLHHAAP